MVKKWQFKNSIVPLFEDVPEAVKFIPDFKSEICDIYASFDDFLNSPEVQDESDKIIENVRRAINEGFLKEK